MLPIYPWMAGRFFRPCSGMLSGDARSLMVAAIIGLVGVAGFIGLVLWTRSVWYGALSAFMLMNCWRGLKQAQALSRLAKSCRAAMVCLPSVQRGAVHGRVLEMREVQTSNRYVPNPGGLSALCGSAYRDELLGLWWTESDVCLDCRGPWSYKGVACPGGRGCLPS